MDPSVPVDSSEKPNVAQTVPTNHSSSKSNAQTGTSARPSINSDAIPTIIVEPASSGNNSPTTPSSPLDVQPTPEPESTAPVGTPQAEDKSSIPSANAPSPTHRQSHLLDEIKYLLKPTNSLSNPDSTLQASQEPDAAIKRRTLQFEDDFLSENDRLLIEGLTPNEVKSLGAAERRSIASRGQRSSYIDTGADRPRSPSARPSTHSRSYSQPPSSHPNAPPAQPTLLDHLPGLMWIFFAAYSLTVILFLTRFFGIDLIFGFFLQMALQTIAFGVYAFYKGYGLLGPFEHRLAMLGRAFLIGLAALTAFLAYYYITLPDLTAVRQSQVIVTIIICIFFLRERVTVSRIFACILVLVAMVVLIRPTRFAATLSAELNTTDSQTLWTPYSSSWNHVVGIGLALCSAILHSTASTIHKAYFTTQHVHDTVVCFWSAVFTLLISSVLVGFTHFVSRDARTFPHDWRLYIAFGLALLSIFAFIANQKAIRRERTSVVTLIYATDIVLALILQNIFTKFKSDAVTLLGCVLMLTAAIIICIETLTMEKNKNILAAKIAEVASTDGQNENSSKRSILKMSQNRLSI